jgi:hypothetical protein
MVCQDEHDNHGACKELRLHAGFPFKIFAEAVDIDVYLISRGP